MDTKDLIIGCNYHTTWQSHKAMRFVLKEIKGDKVRLITRNSNKDFWTDASSLIFINTNHNRKKALDKEALQYKYCDATEVNIY